jgi:hypothetical protein
MISFLLKILLLCVLVAYLVKLLGSGPRKQGPAAAGGRQSGKFNPEGRIIRDAEFTEIKDEGKGKDGPA